jgi:two-component system nitrogen regulation response regulator GlnG
MITPLPGATPLVPGSCTLPLPGIAAAIVDESGTGKELVARTIHRRSGRTGPFVSVGAPTLPEGTLLAELFGRETPMGTRRGMIEEASGGTLFIDEIGNLTEDAQKMLLGVLQEGTVTRLGDVLERRVDVKVVVATHEDLGRMVREGRFRADLYMRLNPACTVTLPPLVARRGDLGRLLAWLAQRVCDGAQLKGLIADYRRRAGLADPGELAVVLDGVVPPPAPDRLVLLLPRRTLRLLRLHAWPGNLRELAMTVENALTFTFAEIAGLPLGARADVVQVRPKLVRDLLRAVRATPEVEAEGWTCQVALKANDTLNHLAQDVERQYFTQLYHQEDGDFGAMARVLMGDPANARKVQLRFNQLGLKVRELKGG